MINQKTVIDLKSHYIRKVFIFLFCFFSVLILASSRAHAEPIWPDHCVVLMAEVPFAHTDSGIIQLDVPAFVDESSRTQVPLRFIAEELGATVAYNEPFVSVTSSNKTVMLEIGSNTAYINDQAVRMDTIPFVKDGRTFVPLRFLSESLGYIVQYRDGIILFGGWFSEPSSEEVKSWSQGLMWPWAQELMNQMALNTMSSTWICIEADGSQNIYQYHSVSYVHVPSGSKWTGRSLSSDGSNPENNLEKLEWNFESGVDLNEVMPFSPDSWQMLPDETYLEQGRTVPHVMVSRLDDGASIRNIYLVERVDAQGAVVWSNQCILSYPNGYIMQSSNYMAGAPHGSRDTIRYSYSANMQLPEAALACSAVS